MWITILVAVLLIIIGIQWIRCVAWRVICRRWEDNYKCASENRDKWEEIAKSRKRSLNNTIEAYEILKSNNEKLSTLKRVIDEINKRTNEGEEWKGES